MYYTYDTYLLNNNNECMTLIFITLVTCMVYNMLKKIDSMTNLYNSTEEYVKYYCDHPKTEYYSSKWLPCKTIQGQ